MRKDPAGRKKCGYVILPIGIRKDTSPETALDDNKKYRVVWQVLNALRAHDDRLDKQFVTIDLNVLTQAAEQWAKDHGAQSTIEVVSSWIDWKVNAAPYGTSASAYWEQYNALMAEIGAMKPKP